MTISIRHPHTRRHFSLVAAAAGLAFLIAATFAAYQIIDTSGGPNTQTVPTQVDAGNGAVVEYGVYDPRADNAKNGPVNPAEGAARNGAVVEYGVYDPRADNAKNGPTG